MWECLKSCVTWLFSTKQILYSSSFCRPEYHLTYYWTLNSHYSILHYKRKKTRSVPLYNTILYLKCCIQDHCWRVLNERVTVLCIIMAEEYKYNVSLKYCPFDLEFDLIEWVYLQICTHCPWKCVRKCFPILKKLTLPSI